MSILIPAAALIGLASAPFLFVALRPALPKTDRLDEQADPDPACQRG